MFMLNVRNVPGLVTGLLGLTVAAHVWAASTPLPLGGPNVVLAVVTVTATAAYVLWRRELALTSRPASRWQSRPVCSCGPPFRPGSTTSIHHT